jgi:hypothetical protein
VSVWWKTQTKPEESTRLTYTGFLGELEHLKIKTRLIDEKSDFQGCLLLIDKVRAKDKTYIWVSVWWKTVGDFNCVFHVFLYQMILLRNGESGRRELPSLLVHRCSSIVPQMSITNVICSVRKSGKRGWSCYMSWMYFIFFHTKTRRSWSVESSVHATSMT